MDVAIPAPRIWTPQPRLPKWAKPWERERTLEDEVVAAVAVDTVSGILTNYSNSVEPPLQTPAFNNVGGDLVVFFIGMGCQSGFTTSLPSVSYGGNGLTKHTERAVTAGGSDSRVQIWYLLGAPTGSNNFSFDPAMTTNVTFDVWAGAMSFTGHDTTTPLTSNIAASSQPFPAGATALSATTPSPVAANNMFLGVIGGGDGTWVGNMDPFQMFTKSGSGSALGAGRAGCALGGGSAMSVGGSQSAADSIVVLGVEIAAAKRSEVAGAAPVSMKAR